MPGHPRWPRRADGAGGTVRRVGAARAARSERVGVVADVEAIEQPPTGHTALLVRRTASALVSGWACSPASSTGCGLSRRLRPRQRRHPLRRAGVEHRRRHGLRPQVPPARGARHRVPAAGVPRPPRWRLLGLRQARRGRPGALVRRSGWPSWRWPTCSCAASRAPRAALVTGLLVAVYPPLLANDTFLLTEPLSFLLMLGCSTSSTAHRWAWAGVACGLLMLSRPSAQFIVVVVAVWVLWQLGWKRALGLRRGHRAGRRALGGRATGSRWVSRCWCQLQRLQPRRVVLARGEGVRHLRRPRLRRPLRRLSTGDVQRGGVGQGHAEPRRPSP